MASDCGAHNQNSISLLFEKSPGAMLSRFFEQILENKVLENYESFTVSQV